MDGCQLKLLSVAHRHQEITADAHPQVIHLVQELREEGVQSVRQNFVDAAILQIGQQAARAALSFGRVAVGQQVQVFHHFVQAGVQ